MAQFGVVLLKSKLINTFMPAMLSHSILKLFNNVLLIWYHFDSGGGCQLLTHHASHFVRLARMCLYARGFQLLLPLPLIIIK